MSRRRRELAAVVTLVAMAAGCGGAKDEDAAGPQTTGTATMVRGVPDAVDLPHPPGAKVGHWRWGALSPDGTTYVATWSAECEIPIAFLVNAGGGAPRAVTGEDDWTQAPESEALGWTTNGEPIVRLLHGACGRGADEPGVYVYGDGEPRRVSDALEPSREPRDVE